MDNSDSSQVDPRVGSLVGERYRLDDRLAAGGMGVVYRGTRVEDGAPVAVKFLHEQLAGLPDLVKRFQREVTAMERLDHPNLVRIIDAGLTAGVPYLVMDFHVGTPLGKLLDDGALDPRRAVRLALQVLDGVAHAHKSGIVHRDLKPDNVLVLDEGPAEQVRVLDFGLAKMLAEDSASALTNTGFALGTPGYMSPEQARGAPTDERSDLYAVGVLLYHMVVGRKPFVAESPLAVLRMHMDELPIPPRKAAPQNRLSPELDAVIVRALEKDPAQRWGTADVFAEKLRDTPEGKQAAREPERRREPVRTGASSGWWRRAGALALVGALVFMGVRLWPRFTKARQRQVSRTIDDAVGVAKDTLRSIGDRIPIPAAPTTPPVAKPADEADDDETVPEPPSVDTPGTRLEASSHEPARARPPASGRRAPRIEDAERALAAGRTDDAIQLLYELRRIAPRSPAVALMLGHAYFRKLWRTDALREYALALELRPQLRSDRLLVRNVVAALDDPTYRAARAIILNRLGAAALGELHRAQREARSPKVEARAGRLIGDLASARRGKNKKR